MKRLLFVAVTLLILTGCSDKNKEAKGDNPFLPIADLVIPREVFTGENVTLQGRGFTEECVLYLRANEENAKNIRTITVSCDKSSITFTVPSSLEMGFYIVVLKKDDNYHKIGGVNIKSNNYLEEDFELFALAGPKQEISPASVGKQLKGPSLVGSSTMLPDCYFGSVVALPDGKVYYSGFYVPEVWPYTPNYRLGSYDMKTQTSEQPKEVKNFFVMGNIDGHLHILKTDNKEIYQLYKLENGQETLVKTFNFSEFGSLPILENDLLFDYHAPSKSLLISGNMGTGVDMAYVAFTLNVQTGVVTSNGGSGNHRCWFALVGEKIYCFASVTNDVLTTTQVLQINDIANWTIAGVNVTQVTTINKSKFEMPTYNPVTGMIYGLDDAAEVGAVLVFNTKTNLFETKKWINPGVAAIFYAEPITE